MNRFLKMGTKVAGFSVPALLSTVSPLLVLPALTERFGSSAWSQIAICQSVGLAMAVLVELGWGLNGPQRVARAGVAYRSKLYLQSVVTKAFIFAPAVVVASIVAILLTSGGSFLVSALLTLASVMTAFSPVWFFVGVGSPRYAIFLDAVPRLVLSVGSAFAIWHGAGLLFYAVAMVLAAMLPPIFALRTIKLDRRSLVGSTERVILVIRTQMYALGGRVASATYIALPVALVGAVSPSAVPVFAASDRLLRMGLVVLQSVPNMLQSWLGGERTVRGRYEKALVSIRLNVAIGVMSGILFGILAPTVSRFVFSGTATVPYWLAGLAGVVMMLTVISRATGGVALVAINDVRAIAISAVTGCVVGVPVIILLAWRFGAGGAVIGQIIAELSVLVVQVMALRSGYGRRAVGVSAGVV